MRKECGGSVPTAFCRAAFQARLRRGTGFVSHSRVVAPEEVSLQQRPLLCSRGPHNACFTLSSLSPSLLRSAASAQEVNSSNNYGCQAPVSQQTMPSVTADVPGLLLSPFRWEQWNMVTAEDSAACTRALPAAWLGGAIRGQVLQMKQQELV